MKPTASNPSLSIKTMRSQIADPLRNEILTQALTEHPLNLAIRGIEASLGKEHADTFRHVQHPDPALRDADSTLSA